MKRRGKRAHGQQLFYTHLTEERMLIITSLISTHEGSWLADWLTTENLPSPNHMTQRVPSAARLRLAINHDTIRPGHQENPRSFPQTRSPIPNPWPSWNTQKQTSAKPHILQDTWRQNLDKKSYFYLMCCNNTIKLFLNEVNFSFTANGHWKKHLHDKKTT